MGLAVWLWGAVIVGSAFLSVAKADDGATDEERRQAAGAAYDRGSKAYLAGDFERAARFYETAFRLAPAAPALIQAVRAYQQAGDDRRAGTVALALQETYGVEQMAEHTTQALEKARSENMRVDVVCEGCQLEIDGEREGFPSVFLEPRTAHTVNAVFETGTRSESVSGEAGTQRVITFTAPREGEMVPQEHPASSEKPPASNEAASTETEGDTSTGLSPVFFWTGVGLTAVLTGITIWSALDTQSAADDYEKNPTQQGLDDGQGLELRTNLLLAASAALLVGTGAVGIFFTDWGGHEKQSTQAARNNGGFHAAATWIPGGAMATVRGRF